MFFKKIIYFNQYFVLTSKKNYKYSLEDLF